MERNAEVLAILKQTRDALDSLVNTYQLTDLTDWLVTLETETIPYYESVVEELRA